MLQTTFWWCFLGTERETNKNRGKHNIWDALNAVKQEQLTKPPESLGWALSCLWTWSLTQHLTPHSSSCLCRKRPLIYRICLHPHSKIILTLNEWLYCFSHIFWDGRNQPPGFSSSHPSLQVGIPLFPRILPYEGTYTSCCSPSSSLTSWLAS